MVIRNFFIAFSMLVLTALSTQAQNSGVGFKGGVNMTKLTSEQPADYDFGYYGGVFLSLPVNQALSIQPEFIYTKYKSTSEYSLAGANYTNEYELDAIQIPLMGKVHFAQILFLEVGPQASFLLSQKQTKTVESSLGGGTTTTEEDLSYKEIEWYINMGAGIELPVGLHLNVRYNLGMNNLNDDSSDDNEVRTRMWQVGIGYRFGSSN
ncbi:porin family protein [Marinigracilibium pacificum]|uniref:PorT family protein n=1 Tax=Marinigracilibium pacificum TaxID=2729599 RepID=A0A848IXM4_9BACT|nr:porin family protein [Marinigracilibium pacificum]NMM49047.1 PorT family protein [Marinigracilibium pacificum]